MTLKCHRAIRGFTRSGVRRGVAAAELAILLPFLGLALVVAVDFCRVYHCTQVVQECARCGALYAGEAVTWDRSTTTLTDAARQAAVAEGTNLNPPLRVEDVTVAVSGTTATVTVTYEFRMLTSYPGIPAQPRVVRSVSVPRMPKAPGAP
jgi:Flp pilus assembly protein TadG